MRNYIRLTFALALLCAAMTTAALASDGGSLYLVHGVPGRDFSTTTDPTFPVDVLVNDEVCYERGLTFGSIAGPLTFAPGSYDIKISDANSLAPCSNPPLVETTVSIESGRNTSAVFAVGTNGTPTLLTFNNNFSPVPAGTARILFAQAADAPSLQVILENTSTQKLYTYSAKPGQLLSESLPAGNYTIEINQGTTTLVASTPVNLFSQSVTLLFSVGEASNQTVVLETRTIRDVI